MLKALFITTATIYVQLQAVKSPYDPSKPVLPAFLPDPKDGALYMMGASLEDPLQKLPWTIPQLVGAPVSVCDNDLQSTKCSGGCVAVPD